MRDYYCTNRELGGLEDFIYAAYDLDLITLDEFFYLEDNLMLIANEMDERRILDREWEESLDEMEDQ
jgi:hypothetical protein